MFHVFQCVSCTPLIVAKSPRGMLCILLWSSPLCLQGVPQHLAGPWSRVAHPPLQEHGLPRQHPSTASVKAPVIQRGWWSLTSGNSWFISIHNSYYYYDYYYIFDIWQIRLPYGRVATCDPNTVETWYSRPLERDIQTWEQPPKRPFQTIISPAILFWDAPCFGPTKMSSIENHSDGGLLGDYCIFPLKYIIIDKQHYRRSLLSACSRSPSSCFSSRILRVPPFASLLLGAGIRWLAGTTSITDLMLNAVALNAILDVDEFLFAGFTPISISIGCAKLGASEDEVQSIAKPTWEFWLVDPADRCSVVEKTY